MCATVACFYWFPYIARPWSTRLTLSWSMVPYVLLCWDELVTEQCECGEAWGKAWLLVVDQVLVQCLPISFSSHMLYNDWFKTRQAEPTLRLLHSIYGRTVPVLLLTRATLSVNQYAQLGEKYPCLYCTLHLFTVEIDNLLHLNATDTYDL
jgi:hypothetical protein